MGLLLLNDGVEYEITSELPYSWYILESVEQGFNYSWNVFGGVSQVLDYSWRIGDMIDQSLAYSWRILCDVGQSLGYSWTIVDSGLSGCDGKEIFKFFSVKKIREFFL